MRKIFLTSGMILCIMCPAFATDPTGIPADNTGHAYNDPTDNCIVSVLGVSSGSASLQADWEANQITVSWNANGGTGTNGAAYNQSDTTCYYDGDISLPATPPERTGYTFAGWQVHSNNNA